jgi:hypothetical protein
MASLTTPLKIILYKVLEAQAEKHTLDLQYDALLAGWPEDVATKLEIRTNLDGSFRASYPKEFADKILSLEYGDEDTPPSPVIRNYLTKIGVVSIDTGGPSYPVRVSLAEMKAVLN